MFGFNLRTLGFGSLMALNDLIMMPMVKNVVGGWNPLWMIVPILAYSIDPIIFYSAIQTESMAIVNLSWNMISNIVVTLVAFLVFKEHVSGVKMAGILIGFVSLFLMTLSENGEEMLPMLKMN